jgi:hypothetical protein
LGLRRHLFDAHSTKEPRSNYIKRKRKWQEKLEIKLEAQASRASCFPADTQKDSASEDNNIITSFEEINILDMEELVEEFTHFNNHQEYCEEDEGGACTTGTDSRISIEICCYSIQRDFPYGGYLRLKIKRRPFLSLSIDSPSKKTNVVLSRCREVHISWT